MKKDSLCLMMMMMMYGMDCTCCVCGGGVLTTAELVIAHGF